MSSVGSPGTRLGPFRLFASAIIAAQLAGLFVYSSYLYDHFDLTDDFAYYTQAWYQIGHWHLNPRDTIQVPVVSFWQSHFEVAMWPIALVSRVVWPHPIVLLWLQDLAICATVVLVARWIAEILGAHARSALWANLAASIALIIVIGDPWWYQAVSFDVHFEVLALPFVVGCAYCLWKGNGRRALVMGSACLLFGDVATTYVVGVALAGVISKRVRKAGLSKHAAGLLALSIAWLGLIVVLGANRNSAAGPNYGYLVHAGPHASAVSIGIGIVGHPSKALSVLRSRWDPIEHVIAAGGLLGILTPWGAGACLVTLLPAALNVNAAFVMPLAAFQTVEVVPLLAVGTVMALVWVASHLRVVVAVVGAGVVVALGAWQVGPIYSTIPSQWWLVDGPAAVTLQRALDHTPESAEVVACNGVVGRFAGRAQIYGIVASPQQFPVKSRLVEIVITARQGGEPAGAAGLEAAERYVVAPPGVSSGGLGAKVVMDNDGVLVALWRPPPRTNVLTLP